VDDLRAFPQLLRANSIDPAGDYCAVFFTDPDALKLEDMKYAERQARAARKTAKRKAGQAASS